MIQTVFIFLKCVIGDDDGRMRLICPVREQEVHFNNVSLVIFHR
jgi:hypothetical protein